MKKFEEPKIEIIRFATPDVITTSGELLDPNKEGYTNNNDDYGNMLNNFYL